MSVLLGLAAACSSNGRHTAYDLTEVQDPEKIKDSMEPSSSPEASPLPEDFSSSATSLLGVHPSDQSTWISWASASDTGAHRDNYGYHSESSSFSNYDRPFSDLSIRSRDQSLEVKAVTAFAGAIGSIQFKQQEILHASHGAAFQYHIRFSDVGMYQNGRLLLNECDNPTEAGNQTNASAFPQYAPSSSYLEIMRLKNIDDLEGFETLNSPVDYIAPGDHSQDYGWGTCANPSTKPWFSGFKIHKFVRAGWRSPLTQRLFNNIVELQAQVDIPREFSKKLVQIEVSAYLRRFALNIFQYDSVSNTLKAAVDEKGMMAEKGGEDGQTMIFTNPDQSFAVALVSFHEKGAAIARDLASTPDLIEAYTPQPSTYAIKNHINHYARVLASQWHFSYPPASVKIFSYLVLGTLAEVRTSVREIVRAARVHPGLDQRIPEF